jgi:CheY-like chemotaxis protein
MGIQHEQTEKAIQEFVRTTLIVEDDAICQKVLKELLSNLGYHVDPAANAPTAILKLRTQSYNLIVTDIGLPAQSGETVIQATRACELNQATPLIVYTAHNDSQQKQHYLTLGADYVATKPYSLPTLKHAIAQCQLQSVFQRKFYFQLKLLQLEVDSCLQREKHTFSSKREKHECTYQLSDVVEKFIPIIHDYLQWLTLEIQKEAGSQ